MKRVHCVIFSISADSVKVREYLCGLESSYPLMILTPHALFDSEQQAVRECFSGDILFKSFADFISDEKAAHCDYEAYYICMQSAQAKIEEYFSHIKERKNRVILRNIQEQYAFESGSVFSDDLGIDKKVWVDKGFINNTTVEVTHQPPPPHYSIVKSVRSWLIRLFSKESVILDSFSVLKYRGVAYLFCGKILRVQQYFKEDVTIERVPIYLAARFMRILPRVARQIERTILAGVIKKYAISTVLSSIHEHSEHYKEIARWAGLEYGVIQDGYIPENYLPYLYKMQFKDAKFYVWDTLSAGLFVINQMRVARLPLYAYRELPEIKHLPEAIKTVLVLTSGAGDWTAVKNRSDDDLMLMAFVEVARTLKHINFIYRCHPLWVHPNHQGEDSIKRAIAYLKSTDLNNIKISAGSVVQSKRYSHDQQLYVEPKSAMDDILQADLVFGEHSFSMIDAARVGKLFASVLIANRRDYFINYSKLGFFHLASKESIVQFINDVENNPGIMRHKYNAAVRKHNAMLNDGQ